MMATRPRQREEYSVLQYLYWRGEEGDHKGEYDGDEAEVEGGVQCTTVPVLKGGGGEEGDHKGEYDGDEAEVEGGAAGLSPAPSRYIVDFIYIRAFADLLHKDSQALHL